MRLLDPGFLVSEEETSEVVGDTSVESGVLIRNHMTRGARGPLHFYLDRFQFQGGVDNMVVSRHPIILRCMGNPESQKITT